MGDSPNSSEWVMHKGKRVRSRIRRAKRKVTDKLESSFSSSSGLIASEENLQTKATSLRRAVELNEELAAALREKNGLEKELEALLDQLKASEAKIATIRKNSDFKDSDGLLVLHAEVQTLRDALAKENDPDSDPNPFLGDFEEMEILCASCSRVASSNNSYSCHKCGFMIKRAKQCAKCLQKVIDDYSTREEEESRYLI